MTTELALLLFNKAAEIGLAYIESRSRKPIDGMTDDEVREAVERIEIPSAASLVEEGRRRVRGEASANDGPDEVGGSFTEGE
jgi:hypothetical protein